MFCSSWLFFNGTYIYMYIFINALYILCLAWRPDINIGCLSLLLFTSLLKQNFIETGAYQLSLNWLAIKHLPNLTFSACSLLGLYVCHHALLLRGSWESKLKILVLVFRALFPLCYLPSPYTFLKVLLGFLMQIDDSKVFIYFPCFLTGYV